MLVHAKLRPVGSRFLATCIDFEAWGVGATRTEALEALRTAVEESEEAVTVAPPEDGCPSPIQIIVVDGAGDRRARN